LPSLECLGRPQLLAGGAQHQAHAELGEGRQRPGQQRGGDHTAGVGDDERAEDQTNRGDRGGSGHPVHFLHRAGSPGLAVQPDGPPGPQLQEGGCDGERQRIGDLERLVRLDESQRRGGEHREKPGQGIERAHDAPSMHSAQALNERR
jgi:hypothetical protein